MKLCVIVFCCILLAGCKKDTGDFRKPVVLVLDYITGNPVEAAAVYEKQYFDWSISCLCYPGYHETLVGFTNPSGTLEHMNIEFLEIRKPGYYNAEKFKYCLYEWVDYSATFHLFRKGLFEITARSVTNNSSSPRLYIYPLLKNGKIPSPYSADSNLLNPGTTFSMAGYGGMTNRLFVIRPGTTDTLYRQDIFLPVNTTMPLIIDY